MNHGLSKLLFVLFLSFCVHCLADCNCSDDGMRFISCPKTYVKPDQIDFYDNGIFVEVNGMIMQTESLSSDAQGIFFVNARERDCGIGQWKCNKRRVTGVYCNACNWAWETICYACGKDRK
jgi:hypothetical protein